MQKREETGNGRLESENQIKTWKDPSPTLVPYPDEADAPKDDVTDKIEQIDSIEDADTEIIERNPTPKDVDTDEGDVDTDEGDVDTEEEEYILQINQKKARDSKIRIKKAVPREASQFDIPSAATTPPLEFGGEDDDEEPYRPPNPTPVPEVEEASPSKPQPKPQPKPRQQPRIPVNNNSPLKQPLFTQRLQTRMLMGIAAIAGLFGVKIGWESSKNLGEEMARATHQITAFNQEKDLYPHPYAVDLRNKRLESPQHAESPQAIPGKLTIHIPITHTVEQNDTLWGIADNMIATSGIPNTDGTLTLELVKSLREENEIYGNPAKSKKMWVGETLNTAQAAKILNEKIPKEAPIAQVKQTHPQEQVSQQTTNKEQASKKQTLATLTQNGTLKNHETLESAIAKEQNIPQELLSFTFQTKGETVWSRTKSILESLGIKNPNVAKRAVLVSIVLADSNMNEVQAMKIKYQGQKGFDAQKDTLNFSRVSQAAHDIAAGMTPNEVAKKYGVAAVYKNVRKR